FECLRLWHRFGAARAEDCVLPLGETDTLAGFTVDLRVEEKVGGEALRWRGVDPATAVADLEAGHGRRVVGFQDSEGDLRRRLRNKVDRRSRPVLGGLLGAREGDPVDLRLSGRVTGVQTHAGQRAITGKRHRVLDLAAGLDVEVGDV